MDCSVNLKKLEKDFEERLSNEIKLQKQTDVRLRTLANPSISYEEYSELLKGAHLKPLKSTPAAELNESYKRKISFKDYEPDITDK